MPQSAITCDSATALAAAALTAAAHTATALAATSSTAIARASSAVAATVPPSTALPAAAAPTASVAAHAPLWRSQGLDLGCHHHRCLLFRRHRAMSLSVHISGLSVGELGPAKS